MRATLAAFTITITIGLAGAVAAQDRPRPPEFVVIVHPTNPVRSIDARFLADAFLKKRTRWPNDRVIAPVDQHARSPVRRAFTEKVLDRSVAAVRSYWRQIVFSGRGVPPPELKTEEDVVAYVRKHRDALGYVSTRVALDGVKVVEVD